MGVNPTTPLRENMDIDYYIRLGSGILFLGLLILVGVVVWFAKHPKR